MTGRGATGLILLAGSLLAVAVGVDLAWYRPARREVDRLLAQRAAIESGVRGAREARQEVVDLLAYAREREGGGGDWAARYGDRDPLSLLEEARTAAGLRRTDLILREKAPAGPFLRTRYFLVLEGPYAKQLRFMRALEQASPLVVIDSFVLEDLPGTGQTMLRINAAVFTLRGEGA